MDVVSIDLTPSLCLPYCYVEQASHAIAVDGVDACSNGVEAVCEIEELVEVVMQMMEGRNAHPVTATALILRIEILLP